MSAAPSLGKDLVGLEELSAEQEASAAQAVSA